MKRTRRHIQHVGPGVVAIVAAAFTLLAGPVIVSRLTLARNQIRVQLAREQLINSSVLSNMNEAVQNIARVVEPSVVHITVRGQYGQSYALSTGSGWVYDNQGHVVTNHHVVDKNGKIEILFSNGARSNATIVGTDRLTDVAVLKLQNNVSTVPAVRATGDDVRQGDLVYVFGSPFGLQFSMSTGIVSGKGRYVGATTVGASNQYQSYIQTDAAINPGNSGGPITNVRGDVIGMNFAIAVDANSRNGRNRSSQFVNSGVGLAIPLEIVEFVADQIINSGTVERGGLGVDLRDLNVDWQEVLNFRENGIRIDYILPNSPADAAGLEANDIIFEVGGQSVHNIQEFRAMTRNKGPGEQMILSVWRHHQHKLDEELQIAVILSRWDEDRGTTLPTDSAEKSEIYEFETLGLSVIKLDNARLNRLGFDSLETGIYVQSVRTGSIASDIGLRAGWVVVEAGGQAVESIQQLESIVTSSQAKTSGVDLKLMKRNGDQHVIHLQVAEEDDQ